MFEKSGVFTEVFAQKGNLATFLDARIKIAFIAIALVINLLSPTVYTPVAIAVFCLVALIAIRIPPKLVMLRLMMPLVMALVVLVTQVFLYGTTPLFTISLREWQLAGYEEGLVRGILIMGRVLAGVSLILLLSMSTPANRLFLAARWFRVPRLFIELALLVYRYIFVLIEEAVAIREAQKVRLGYHNWRQSIRSVNTLGSSLLLRAYDRAERAFEAMSTRGYAGGLPVAYRAAPGAGDLLAAACLTMLLLAFFLAGRLGT